MWTCECAFSVFFAGRSGTGHLPLVQKEAFLVRVALWQTPANRVSWDRQLCLLSMPQDGVEQDRPLLDTVCCVSPGTEVPLEEFHMCV